MENFFDGMNNRRNVKAFIQDNYPQRFEIDSILDKTMLLSPIKNDIYHFSVQIYGPEHANEKEKLVLNTIRDEDKKNLPIQEIKKHYGNKTAKFNNQVKAPYLLLYKKSLNHHNTNNFSGGNYEIAAMGAMIHGYIVSVIANQRNIQATFCACYSNKDNPNYIINNREDFYFMLGLGYAKSTDYKVKKMPKLDEVREWK